MTSPLTDCLGLAQPPVSSYPIDRPARSDLAQHLGREQLEVVEIGQVEHLQIHPGAAPAGELADPLYDLGRGPSEPVGHEFFRVAPDGVRAAAELCVVAADAH